MVLLWAAAKLRTSEVNRKVRASMLTRWRCCAWKVDLIREREMERVSDANNDCEEEEDDDDDDDYDCGSIRRDGIGQQWRLLGREFEFEAFGL